MEATGGFEHAIDVVLAPIAEHIAGNMEDLCAANRMRNPHPHPRIAPVRCLLIVGEFTLRWLLFWLEAGGVGGRVALKARIFPLVQATASVFRV